MKKFLLFLILIFPLFFITACKNNVQESSTLEKIKTRNKIIVGTKIDSKPFCYKENGVLKGYDIDLAKLIAKTLLGSEKNLEFVELNAMDRIYALNSKQVDVVIASMSITPARQEIIDFSTPYYVTGQTLLVKKGSNIKGLKNLSNKTIGIILGSTGEGTIKYLLPESKIRSSKTYTEAYKYLKYNQVDAVLADDSILYSTFKNNPNYVVLRKKYTKEYYAIALRKGDDSLKSQINLIIEDLTHRGKLTQLKTKWL